MPTYELAEELVDPKSQGWQRRPDLDTRHEQAWQRPEGTIYRCPHGGLVLSKIKHVEVKKPRFKTDTSWMV